MCTKKVLFVAGSFDDNGGKFSKLADAIRQGVKVDSYLNGGQFTTLEHALLHVPNYDVIVWFANVPNDKPKLVSRIKAVNKKAVLVTSKRNDGEAYNLADIVQHGLKNHANLMVEFAHDFDRYRGRLLDPLGNEFIRTDDFTRLGQVLGERIEELTKFTRIESVELADDDVFVPNEEPFFAVCRDAAVRFAELLPQPTQTDRFLGNASFRCRWGFPSFRKERIFVSRRNIDKEQLDKECFVGVEPSLVDGKVAYYGHHKPSVDTPIHLELYKMFPRAKFILHGHVYVTDGEWTQKVIPCGALEEVTEIRRAVTGTEIINFTVNLKGHGFVAVADNPKYFETLRLKYYARPMPEPATPVEVGG